MTYFNNARPSIRSSWLSNHDQEIAQLRLLLKQCDAWPAAGDNLLELLATSSWNAATLKQEDAQCLPQVVEATLSGQDIGAQYPSFFQKLLSHASLRQEFIIELRHNMGELARLSHHV
jgi:hypothetical protein